jgi:hypothetical protein
MAISLLLHHNRSRLEVEVIAFRHHPLSYGRFSKVNPYTWETEPDLSPSQASVAFAVQVN